jgi:hypothetical protein
MDKQGLKVMLDSLAFHERVKGNARGGRKDRYFLLPYSSQGRGGQPETTRVNFE